MVSPTLVRLSKASRFPLTPKRGNKDYYKGTRQAFLPGGHRTGAPGTYFGRAKAQYRIVDEKVRYYVAPPIEDIVLSPMKPYVQVRRLNLSQHDLDLHPFGKIPQGGMTGQHYLDWTLARDSGQLPLRSPDSAKS